MSNDNWRTPPEVFNTLNKEFNFVADMACNRENQLCSIGFTENQDSLSFDWDEEIKTYFTDSVSTKYVYCNPPYSKPMPWVKQAVLAQSKGLGVVMVLNADTSVSWFAEAIKFLSEVRFLIGDEKESGGYSIGRIAFHDAEGNPGKQNNKPQFVLIFNPFKIGARVTTYITKKELYGK
jgi:phage N-6-adenine-methyltransferase